MSVRVLTYLRTPFVPPQGLYAVVSETDTIISKHFTPLLWLICSHRTNNLALEGGDCSLTSTVQRSSTITVFCYAPLLCNSFQLHIPPPQQSTATAPLSKGMAGTRRWATASCSSTATGESWRKRRDPRRYGRSSCYYWVFGYWLHCC
jgi:hypothetical protein